MARAAVLLHDHILVSSESLCQCPEKVVEHHHPLTVWKCQHNLVISTSLLCFKGGGCWFLCYFWQSDWLVGTSLSESPETGNVRGTVMSTWSLSSWKQRWLCVQTVAPRLFGPESSKPAVSLSYSHKHSLIQSFPSLAMSKLSQCSRWMSQSDHTKQTTFHLFDF